MPKPIHGLLDSLIEQFAAAVASVRNRCLPLCCRPCRRAPQRRAIVSEPRLQESGAGPAIDGFAGSMRAAYRFGSRSASCSSAKAIQSAARLARAARPGGRSLDMRCRVEGARTSRAAPGSGTSATSTVRADGEAAARGPGKVNAAHGRRQRKSSTCRSFMKSRWSRRTSTTSARVQSRLLRWVQEAALAHSTALGFPEPAYLARGQAWVVRTHEIEYLRARSWATGFASRRAW